MKSSVAFLLALGPAAIYSQTSPVINVQQVQSWLKDLDPDLDEQFEVRSLFSSRNSVSAHSGIQEDSMLLHNISAVFATPAGRERARTLLMEDSDFIAFNQEASSGMQEQFCEYTQSESSFASADVKDCVCGETDDAFVACMAVLEQEVGDFVRQRENKRRELGWLMDEDELYGERNLLGKCEIELEGHVPMDDFDSFISTVADSFGSNNGRCAKKSCAVPIFSLPLEARFSIEACSPDVNLEQLKDGIPREFASETQLSLEAGVCLMFSSMKDEDETLRAIFDILEFFGFDLCPIQLVGSVRPLLGIFEAEISAKILGGFFFARGSLTYMFNDHFRNTHDLCDGIDCYENSDCAMCQGDILSDAKVGVDLLFREYSHKFLDVGKIDGCVSADSGQCKTGVGTDKAKAGEA